MATDVNMLIPAGTLLFMAGWMITVVVWEYRTTTAKNEQER